MVQASGAPGLGRCLLALVVLWACSGTSSAIELNVEVGLGGLVPSGGWTPIEVRCSLGEGEQPFQGRLVLDRPSFAVSAYAAPVRLAPGKSTVVRLCVPVGAGSAYTVRLEDAEGHTVQEASPGDPWQNLEIRDRLVLLLGDKGLSLFAGKSKTLPRLARISPDRLPWDARALEEVCAIFVPGEANAELVELCQDSRVVALLTRYVEEGGRLVFAPRPGVPPPWRGTALEALVPVSAPRLVGTSTDELSFFVGDTPKAELTVLSATLRPGATWKQHNGSYGVVAERPRGRGKTVFLAFDVDDPQVRSASKFPKAIGGLVPHRSVFALSLRERRVDELAGQVFQTRSRLGALGFTLLVMAILLHLAVLGPLASMASKRRGPWAALVVPPAASLLIGLLILFAGALTRGEAQVRSMEFVFHDPQRAGVGHAQLLVGLYAGSDTTFSLQVPSHWNPTLQERSPLDALTFRAPGPALEFREGATAALGPLSVSAGGFTQLRMRGTVSGPALSLKEGSTPGQVRLVSEADRAYDGLIGVAFDGAGTARMQLLPPLAAGAELEWESGRGLAIESAPFAEDLFAQDAGPARDLLARQVATLLRDEYSRSPLIPGSKRKRSFPGAWVLWIESGADAPVVPEVDGQVLGAEHVRAIRVHMVPVGEEP